MSLPSRLLGANPSIQVSTLLSGSLSTPSAKQAFVDPASFESISTTTLASNQASITLSSIPQTYKHLQIRCMIRSSRSGEDYPLIAINGGGIQSTRHSFTGQGSTTGGGAGGLATAPDYGTMASATYGSSYFSPLIIDILDYTNATTKYRTLKIHNGFMGGGGSGRIEFQGAYFNTQNAISSITLTTYYGQNYVSGTTVALYGLKAG